MESNFKNIYNLLHNREIIQIQPHLLVETLLAILYKLKYCVISRDIKCQNRFELPLSFTK